MSPSLEPVQVRSTEFLEMEVTFVSCRICEVGPGEPCLVVGEKVTAGLRYEPHPTRQRDAHDTMLLLGGFPLDAPSASLDEVAAEQANDESATKV